ncbi:MAG: GNAT family N-acetyltransferase [Elusimicrobia bacterium]|nr:GNAT family N-acetyltransferase [Elusimicrobiota bacterium]
MRLSDRARIEAFLRRDPFLHGYELGDLDDRFWPDTAWYGLVDAGRIRALALLYTGLSEPTLLALASQESAELARLLRELSPLLPPSLYCHLTPSLGKALEERYALTAHGEHYKMALKDPSRLETARSAETVELAPGDRAEVERFYAESYPGNWFVPSLLDTGYYVGIREGGRLICAAGVHVYSARQKVAALGNIATRPEARGRGHAEAATAELCRRLLKTVSHICLNVKADNRAAIACYRKLGFEAVASYEEYHAQLRKKAL